MANKRRQRGGKKKIHINQKAFKSKVMKDFVTMKNIIVKKLSTAKQNVFRKLPAPPPQTQAGGINYRRQFRRRPQGGGSRLRYRYPEKYFIE